MISIEVDEAYAFDYLSILQVKKQKFYLSNDAWHKCYMHLQNQFDPEKWLLMINSDEYKNMIKANELTFDAVDKAKNNGVTAQHVDYCNYQMPFYPLLLLILPAADIRSNLSFCQVRFWQLDEQQHFFSQPTYIKCCS